MIPAARMTTRSWLLEHYRFRIKEGAILAVWWLRPKAWPLATAAYAGLVYTAPLPVQVFGVAGLVVALEMVLCTWRSR